MATRNLEYIISARDRFTGTANRIMGTLGRMERSAGRIGRGFGQLAGGLGRIGLVAGGIAAGGLIAAGKAAIDFEDAFAGVRKTVDPTTADLEALRKSFRGMATEIPIAATDFARLGETAGALGITGTANIEKFVRVAALLGVTTNLSADTAATSLGHLATVLRLTGDDFDRFGAALVDLGNKGASTEDQIIAIAERAGGAATTIGLSADALLGFAAAVANMGIEAEAGGSSLQRFFLTAQIAVAEGGKELKGFARTAGLTAKQFQTQFSSDPKGALGAFIVGLGKLSKAEKLAALDAVGLTDIRIIRTLLGLASNTDNLTDSLENSRAAWQANSALTTEAAKRFDTVRSRLQVLRNNLVEAAITVGEGFAPAIGRAAEKLTAFLKQDEGRAQLKKLGEDIGAFIDKIDWAAVIAGAQTFFGIAKSIVDVIAKIPVEISAAVVALGGLNKLSGGLLGAGAGNIIGGLGGAATRGLAARIPGVGSVFAQPVYVTNWAMMGGGLGGAVGGAGRGVAAGLFKVAVVGAVTVAGFEQWSASVQNVADENLRLQKQGLTPREIAVLRFANAGTADRELLRKRLFGGAAPSEAETAAVLRKMGATADRTPGLFDTLASRITGAIKGLPGNFAKSLGIVQRQAEHERTGGLERLRKLRGGTAATPGILLTAAERTSHLLSAVGRGPAYRPTIENDIKALVRIQAGFVARGDTKSAATIGGYIRALEVVLRGLPTGIATALGGWAGGLSPTEREELRRPIVNTTVNVNVTPRQMTTATTTQTRYGPATGSAGGRWGGV